MIRVSFEKYQGAGNDFIIFSETSSRKVSLSRRRALTKKLCDRRFGIGADGSVFLKKISSKKFQWDFYNADGSRPEMCGNAARCVTAALGKGGDEISVKTGRRDFSARGLGLGLYEVRMNLEKTQVKKVRVKWGRASLPAAVLNSGVPHLILEVGNVKHEKFLELARRERHKWGPRGTNVTLFSRNAKGGKAVTFERGVEGFTLACGTGALAVAKYLQEIYGYRGWCKVDMPGGRLSVRWRGSEGFLRGPAERTYSGYIDV